MGRDIYKKMENGRKIIARRPRLDLYASEITSLCDTSRSDREQSIVDAICQAFYLGVSVGAQITREERKE